MYDKIGGNVCYITWFTSIYIEDCTSDSIQGGLILSPIFNQTAIVVTLSMEFPNSSG